MDYKKINSHIILMLIGIAFIIIIAGISRFIVITKGFDTGTANIAFLVVFIILAILYLIILSTLAHIIVPWIMKRLPERKSNIPVEEKIQDITDENENSKEQESEPEEVIIEESTLTQTIESVKQDSVKRYEEKISTKIKIFQDYSHLAMGMYITSEELLNLDKYIECYAREESLPKDVMPLKPDKLKNHDMFHFGWNMAHYFGYKKQDVVPWLQQVFADLKELEPSTIKGKLSDYQKEKYIIPNIDDIPQYLEKKKG